MKKLSLIILCLLCLCGCEVKNKNKSNDNKENLKSYTLTEYVPPCDLDNISFIGGHVILSNNKLYVFSNKKFSETNSNCKLLDSEKTYSYVDFDGSNIPLNAPGITILLANDGKYYQVTNLEDINKVSVSLFEKYENYEKFEFYHNFGVLYALNVSNCFASDIADNIISLSTIPDWIEDASLKCGNDFIEIPNDEKMLMVYGSVGDYYFITNKNIYTVAKSENDKCDEYEDVPCTYVLKKSDMHKDFFDEYRDNMLFFGNGYLITKDNKIYKVEFNN